MTEEMSGLTKDEANKSPQTPQQQTPDGVLSLVLAIVGVLFFQPLCIVSLILSLKDKKVCQEMGATVPSSITIAIIISIIGVVLLIIGVLIALIFLLFLIPEFVDSASS